MDWATAVQRCGGALARTSRALFRLTLRVRRAADEGHGSGRKSADAEVDDWDVLYLGQLLAKYGDRPSLALADDVRGDLRVGIETIEETESALLRTLLRRGVRYYRRIPQGDGSAEYTIKHADGTQSQVRVAPRPSLAGAAAPPGVIVADSGVPERIEDSSIVKINGQPVLLIDAVGPTLVSVFQEHPWFFPYWRWARSWGGWSRMRGLGDRPWSATKAVPGGWQSLMIVRSDLGFPLIDIQMYHAPGTRIRRALLRFHRAATFAQQAAGGLSFEVTVRYLRTRMVGFTRVGGVTTLELPPTEASFSFLARIEVTPDAFPVSEEEFAAVARWRSEVRSAPIGEFRDFRIGGTLPSRPVD